MSLSFFRNALRLHGSRILHLPRSRVARYGIFTGAAVLSGALYLNHQAERMIMSDEFTTEPPMPPELDRDFRFGLFALKNDAHDDAWEALLSVWDRAEAAGESPLVLANVAQAISRIDPESGDPEAHHNTWRRIAGSTLRALLHTGLATTLERGIAAGFAVAVGATSGDAVAATPFLQWAFAQNLQVTSEGFELNLGMMFDQLNLMSEATITSCTPIVLATLSFYDPLTVATDGTRLRPVYADAAEIDSEERCHLAHIYLFLALHRLDAENFGEWPVIARLQRRALALLDGADEDLATLIVATLALQLGLQSQALGDGDGAFELYLLAKACSPPGSAAHDAATAAIMRILQVAEQQSDP